MPSSSENTLKSLTISHTIRGKAILKDVERFRNWLFERNREFIKLFIVNYAMIHKLFIHQKPNMNNQPFILEATDIQSYNN